jgi:polyhydroxyalkanoate synthesis regulator phasin
LGKFSLEQIEQNVNLLKALSKESIKKGEHQQIADSIESVQNATRKLLENKDNIAERVTREVTEIIGDSVSQRVEDEAKNFVDELVESLSSQSADLGVDKPRMETEPPSDGKYMIEIRHDGLIVERISGETQAKAMANVADYLIEEWELLEYIELPYKPGSERGHTALINDEPVHTNGQEMRLYEELGEGLFIYTSLNAQTKTRYISELVEKVGLMCEFSDSWGGKATEPPYPQ